MAKSTKRRVFKRTTEKIHDLYKLLVSNCMVNQQLPGAAPTYRPVEHVHFYHSIDSKGVPLNTSISVCGHFHVMKVLEPATDDGPAVLECSPPMIWVRARDAQGQWVKKLQLANRDDTHTHEVQYVDSHKFTPAKINPEFVKLQQTQAAPAGVPGIVDG